MRLTSNVRPSMVTSLHALSLALVLIGSLALSATQGQLPRTLTAASGSLGRALLAMFGALALMVLLVPSCKCGPGNNPFSQIYIPVFAVMAVAFFVSKPKVRRAFFLFAVAAGIGLSFHFKSLVLSRSACQYTGDPRFIENSCSQPAVAERLWHTRLTGIYALKKV